MNIKFKIALRYVFPRGNFNFISIITIVSIIGIAIGVAALIIVMSIFNGFRTTSESAILDMDPAVRIIGKKSPYIIHDTSLIKQIELIPNVKKIIPTLQTKAVIVNNDKIEVVELISYNKNLLDKKLFVFGSKLRNNNDIILGIALLDRLKATLYDTMKLISMYSLKNAFTSLQLPTGIDVVAMDAIQTSIKNYDLANCYADYSVVKKIAGKILDGAITQIDIFSTKNDEKTTSELAFNISKILPKEYTMQTWIDLNKDLYNIMQMERVAVFCIMSLILLIAIFNVFASLAMTVMEKKQEIALLKALGAENSMLTQIYIIEGILIGSIGTIIGLVIGLGFVLGQIHFSWFKLNASVYIASALPMKLNQWEVIIICLFSLFLSIIAAYFPAKSATKRMHEIRLNNE
jgi:lipoprotein-releasing system permease protein